MGKTYRYFFQFELVYRLVLLFFSFSRHYCTYAFACIQCHTLSAFFSCICALVCTHFYVNEQEKPFDAQRRLFSISCHLLLRTKRGILDRYAVFCFLIKRTLWLKVDSSF